MDILSKIQLVDNELVSSIVVDIEQFKESLDTPNILLKKYNRTKIEKFIRELKAGDAGFILLDASQENYNKTDIDKFVDLELVGNAKRIYRVLVLSHTNLNKELDFLLGETVVIFSDENLSLDNF